MTTGSAWKRESPKRSKRQGHSKNKRGSSETVGDKKVTWLKVGEGRQALLIEVKQSGMK